MAKKFIADFSENESISGYFGVVSKSIRKTKTGADYLDLTLVDRTGKINAKIWDKTDEFKDKFNLGDAVAVKGQIVSFNDELQIRVDQIRKATEELDKQYGFDLSDIIPRTSKNIDQMWNEIRDISESISDPFMRMLVANIYEKYEQPLRKHPGSLVLHHAYLGGLLEHIHAMSRLGVSICENYPELNRDLVLTGVLLHDIGKLKELNFTPVTNYSDVGNFIGHIVLGRDILIEEAARIDNFPELLRLKLEHIILSHQGKLEWQSPKEPMFLEALAVYYIDEIDTRINQMKNEIESDTSDANWTSRNNYFRRVLYKGE